jgi:hypothetical protein
MSVFVIYNYQKELKLMKDGLLEHLVATGVENHEEYRYILGKIHMLDMCQQELSRLLEQEEKTDD